ncbi:rwd domain-containing protein [Coemansia sp. RSA 1822]|nr:rwd domain-containing protein [Coemansia sp. RSA 638]KAJ2126082.1 rwd domain-containing protein [Coemansia sp. RSA 720]KAJ2541347.1 rwd domain-containing protein [Coemansia sp. RSA 1853]KAJ2562488.1 rwd domain-containing protein [Coemansia sp. RSA 1822]
MTDTHYAEEQANEIEILQSIYPTEFEELSADPHQFSITVPVEEDDVRSCTLCLTVTYTATYPDELPEFTISVLDDDEDAPPLSETDATLDTKDIDDLTAQTRTICEESLGMAMVFSMASNLREIAALRLVAKTIHLKQLREQRIQKEVEAEQAKFIGTPVTRENFLEWKAHFDCEASATKSDASAGDDKASRRVAKPDDRLTGRQLFEQDKDLAKSDSKFINEGDISVDSKLFGREQDLSDNE